LKKKRRRLDKGVQHGLGEKENVWRKKNSINKLILGGNTSTANTSKQLQPKLGPNHTFGKFAQKMGQFESPRSISKKIHHLRYPATSYIRMFLSRESGWGITIPHHQKFANE